MQKINRKTLFGGLISLKNLKLHYVFKAHIVDFNETNKKL